MVKQVNVSYVDHGFGPALAINAADATNAGTRVGEADGELGLLRLSDAVITLEIARPDGQSSVLTWDPAEVSFDPIV